MFITPSFKKSLIVEQFRGNYLKKLYMLTSRPHLDYASQVWSPQQAYLSDMVEAVQRRATNCKLMVGNRISFKELFE